MTILVQQQLRTAAQEVSPWSGALSHTWKSKAEDYTWIVGHVDEDGVQYTVARVEADAYDYQGVSEKLAEFFRLANPAAVLALLDEIERLQAALQEERQLRAKVGRIAHYLNEFASGRSSFSRIQEINDAIQEVPDGH